MENKNIHDIISETLLEIKQLNIKIAESDNGYLLENMDLFLKKEELLICKLEKYLNFLNSDPISNKDMNKYCTHLTEIVVRVKETHIKKIALFKFYKDSRGKDENNGS